MKVYSWETLIATLLIAGGAFIYEFKNLILGDKTAFIPILDRS